MIMPIGGPMGAFGPGGFMQRPNWGNNAQGPGQVPMQLGGGGMQERPTPMGLGGPAPLGPGSLPSPGLGQAGPGMGLAQPMQAPTGGLQPPMGGLGGGGGGFQPGQFGGGGGPGGWASPIGQQSYGPGLGGPGQGMQGLMNLLMQHPAIQNLMQGLQGPGSLGQSFGPNDSGYAQPPGLAQHPLAYGPQQGPGAGMPAPFSPAWQQRMQQGPGSLGQAAQPLPTPFSSAWQQRMQGPQQQVPQTTPFNQPVMGPEQNQPPAPFSPGWAQWMQNQQQPRLPLQNLMPGLNNPNQLYQAQ